MRSGRQPRFRGGGFLDDLFRIARDMIAGSLIESAKEAGREFLHRSLRAFLRVVVGSILLGAGAVFLLIGGFETLRLLRLPDAAAYAIMGALGLGAGLAAFLSAGSRNEP